MREGHVISDGEAVGLVRLSVHYKNSGMFMAHDVKTHASLQPTGSVPDRSLMISYSHFVQGSPSPTAHAGYNQHCSGDPTKAEIRKFLAKKDSEAYPIARGAD